MVTKIAQHYTEFNLLYKNLKTNHNPKLFITKISQCAFSQMIQKSLQMTPFKIEGSKVVTLTLFLLFYIVKK